MSTKALSCGANLTLSPLSVARTILLVPRSNPFNPSDDPALAMNCSPFALESAGESFAGEVFLRERERGLALGFGRRRLRPAMTRTAIAQSRAVAARRAVVRRNCPILPKKRAISPGC